MKGLFVINSLEGGGAEKVFVTLMSLIDSDKSKEYDFQVIILDDYVEKYNLPENITIHRLGNSFGKLGQLIKFITLIGKFKPDFVFSFLFRSNHFNAIASKIFNYKCILSERSNTNGRINGRFQRLKKAFVKIVFSKADAIVAVSKGVGDCLVDDYAIDKNKVKLLNNPYDIKELIELSNEENSLSIVNPYIIAVGRLVKTKGFDDLIIAFSKAKITYDLKILGQGPELEDLEALAIKHNVRERVEFCGFQENPSMYIKNSQFFVLSSYLEGFPNALVEAMVLSKAVLASNCTDGPKEILELKGNIQNGEAENVRYGLIYNPGDIHGLTSGMEKYFASDTLVDHYSKMSYQRAADFSRENFYSNFKSILKEVNGI